MKGARRKTMREWNTPHEWLQWRARRWNEGQLYGCVLDLLKWTDDKVIEQIFRSDMEADGYDFEEEMNENMVD